MPIRPAPLHRNLAPLLLATAAAVVLVATRPAPAETTSLEARQRAAVAEDLAAGSSRGMQGLVGSPYLAPLPTVLVTLVGLVPFVGMGPALGSVVAAGAAAGLALYLNALWRRHGVGAGLRYAAILFVLLLPPVTLSVQSGQTDMLFVALVVGGCGALLEWTRGRSVGRLAASAILIALAAGTRWQGLLVAGGAFVFLAGALLARRGGWSRFEGTLLIYCTPIAYVAALWLASNWLILGDPLFVVRAATGPVALGITDARTLLARGCPWALTAALGGLALAAPAACWLRRGPARGRLASAVAAASLLGAALLAIGVDLGTDPQAEPTDIPRTVQLLEARYPNGAFVVSGYAGYSFTSAAGRAARQRWVHVMHLTPGALARALSDYHGRDVYVLVNPGEATDRWEHVGLSWEAPGARIPERFLYARRVGPWVLFEVLREDG